MKFNFVIEKNSDDTIYIQLYTALKKMIDDEEIKPREKLPSIRQLAMKYDLSKLTVLKAYDLLEKNNLIYKIHGKGCFVKEKTSLYEKMQKPIINNFAIINKNINFASSTPCSDLYPIEEFREIINSILLKDGEKLFNYSDTQGCLKLRELIVTMLKKKGIKETAQNIQIVTGAQQALDILNKIMLKNEHPAMAVGAPTYYGAINTFSDVATMVPVPVCKDGFDLEALEHILQNKKIDYLYAMINFECPTGIVWSQEKKKHLLELAEKYDFLIIEDDCISDLYYYDNPTTPLKSLDKNERVIYINSFSKVIMPGLRLGYMVIPEKYITEVIAAKFSSDISSSGLMQMATYHFINEGHFQKHLENLKKIYKERYEFTLKCLEKIKGIEIFALTGGGFYFWIKLPDNINSNLVYAILRDMKISILPGTVFYIDKNAKSDHIRLSFASAPVNEIKKGVDKLHEVILSLQQIGE